MAQTESRALPEAGDNRTIQLDGARLASLRRARALTREQLADAADGAHRLSEATIKRAEAGARVYLETARRLAAVLGVSVDTLAVERSTERELAEPAPGDEVGSSASVAVAVLPFRALDPSAETQTFADGIAEDLTTRLGRWWFPVICRGSTARYGELYGRDEVARDLQVAYLLDGSVQRAEDVLRVHARLIDARTGALLWAQEFTRPATRLFLLQDELTAGIVDGVNRKLLALSERVLERIEARDLSAWQLAARGCRLFHEGSQRANGQARALLAAAVAADGALSYAIYALAMTYQRDIINQWSADLRGAVARMAELSDELERHHPADGRGDVVAAYVLVYRGERERAIERLRVAIEASPNLHVAYSLLGQTMAMGNQPEPALEQLEIAARLSPRDSDLWNVRTATALTYFVAEDYVRAAAWAESASTLRHDAAFSLATLAAAHALAGAPAAAKSALQRMLQLRPHASVDAFGSIQGSTDPAIAARFLRGLQLAGL